MDKNIEISKIKLELINDTLEPIEREKIKYESLIKALKEKNRSNMKKK